MRNKEAETDLMAFLTSRAESLDRSKLKHTFEDFVVEYGWWYDPVEPPKQFVAGKPQQCHVNATDLVIADNGLVYCEGYAVSEIGIPPTIHAWVTDGEGNAFDNTWSSPGVAYAGVPFQSMHIVVRALKEKAVVSLIDDWRNKYPLLTELWDRSHEWLEPNGSGVEKLER